MGKILVITEKPSVAMEYSKVLNVRERKNGYMESDKYIISWCVGHLVTMSYPEKYDEKYKQWNMDELPFLPEKYKYEVISAVKDQYKVLHGLMNSPDVDTIMYCGDSGREGELIGRLVRNYGGVRPGVKEIRVWIDSYVEDEILRGIREAKPLSYYDNLALAGEARGIEDYALGINFSRALTVKYGQKYNSMIQSGKWKSLSVGRVMTCVLGMVVKRERDIRNFVPTVYHKVQSNICNGIIAEWKINQDSQYYNSPLIYDNKGFYKKEDAEQFTSQLPSQVTIRQVQKKVEKKNAPYLYNLADLQGDCTKLFKISPEKTLQIAQTLYEKKLTTYPRTDARVLSTAVAKEIEGTILGLKSYSADINSYCERIIQNGWEKHIVNTKYVDDAKISDHYAIIPTGQGFGTLENLDELEKQVYNLIVRRFLSIFYPAAEYYKISVEENAGKEMFSCSAKVLKAKGYLEILNMEKDAKEEQADISRLEELREGQVVQVTYQLHQSTTQPPKRYTSGSMVLAMENAGKLIEDEELRSQINGSGIGTSATRATIISKLIKNGYVCLDEKTQILTPHRDGEALYDIVAEVLPDLLSPEMTAELEKDFTRIEKGELDMTAYKEKMEGYIRSHVEKIKGLNDGQNYEGDYTAKEKEELGICPVCGKPVYENSKAFSCSGYKEGCNWGVWKNDKYFQALGKKVTKTMIKELLHYGQVTVSGLKSKSEKKYSMDLKLVKRDKYWNWEKVER